MIPSLYKDDNAVNIFSDASTIKINDIPLICSGYVQVFQDKEINSETQIWANCSSVFGELYAFYLGLNDIYTIAQYNIARNVDPNGFIYNIYTDSIFVKDAISNWIFHWMKQAEQYRQMHTQDFQQFNCPPNLVTKGDTQVKYQQLFMNIINTILASRVYINIYHIKAHKNHKNPKQVKEVRKKFAALNNVSLKEVNHDDIRHLMKWNDRIDKLTRNNLKTAMNDSKSREFYLQRQLFWPMTFFPNNLEQIYEFKRLVR